MVLGTPEIWARNQDSGKRSGRIKTNIDDVLEYPRSKYSLPGLFPGRVVEGACPDVVSERRVSADRVKELFNDGIASLTGLNPNDVFHAFFNKNDVVGIKVNPVGAGIISTHLVLVDAVIDWLEKGGLSRQQIVIWDRFDYMLSDAGYTQGRYPGIQIEGLQTMDEAAAEGTASDNSRWLNQDGTHVSQDNFDQDVYYWADVDGPQEDLAYLNQHVFNGKYSYFGKMLTQKLNKIINIPVFKNTGNGISMATKNMGYGSICNSNRLHKPLFFDVCTEVLAFPAIRDKLVLNITDGLVGQYDGGPGPNAQFTYDLGKLYFATDPFALDMVCHRQLLAKRKQMGVSVNEHPRYTDYLRYAERLGLGVADPEKIDHVKLG